jgi:hypothetical protein
MTRVVFDLEHYTGSRCWRDEVALWRRRGGFGNKELG